MENEDMAHVNQSFFPSVLIFCFVDEILLSYLQITVTQFQSSASSRREICFLEWALIIELRFIPYGITLIYRTNLHYNSSNDGDHLFLN